MPILEIASYLALGAIIVFMKLPKAIRMTLAAYPLVTDVAVTYAMYAMHDSNISGTLAAAIGGAIFAVFLTIYTAITGAKP